MDISRSVLRHRSAGAALAVLAAALTVAACGSSGDSSSSIDLDGQKAAANSNKPVRIAYLSFAVANSYDAPMLAAAQTVAKGNNATIKVFDANNDPKKQFAQLQTATTSGDYDAIIVQPIFGTGLITGVQDAISAGKKVVNMDQILGKDMSTDQPQVDGLSGNVVFVPTEIGTKLGKLVDPGLPGEEPRPVQGRLPVRHQGLGARRRDQEVLRRGDRREPGEGRRRRARASSPRRSA